MAGSLYQVVLIGGTKHRHGIVAAIKKQLGEFGLSDETIAFLDENSISVRKKTQPLMGVFLGTQNPQHSPAIDELLAEAVTIVPIVSNLEAVSHEVPESLRHVNALALGQDGSGMERLVSLVLETFRLLRRERRLFISYRRKESQSFANLLYDELDARGFDVFIDVRSVPPGVDFQAELWQRMSDSDVVVLIDTPGFRASRWTQAELAQANLTSVQILHVLWPGQAPDPESSMSTFFPLTDRSFRRSGFPNPSSITRGTILDICAKVEELRARAMVWRHRYLVDTFCDSVKDEGLKVDVQPERWLSVSNGAGRTLAVIPAVGRPTSDRLNEIVEFVKAPGTKHRGLWVIYDERGLHPSWRRHLDWLDEHLPVRALPVMKAIAETSGFFKS